MAALGLAMVSLHRSMVIHAMVSPIPVTLLLLLVYPTPHYPFKKPRASSAREANEGGVDLRANRILSNSDISLWIPTRGSYVFS